MNGAWKSKLVITCLALLMVVSSGHSTGGKSADDLYQTDIYVAGKDGYHTYRIPSLIVTLKGTLLAFSEGRKRAQSDTGDIDIVLRRSFDRGKTWTPLRVIADDGDNVMGNPCPVVDRSTGTIWLLITRNLGVEREREIINGTSKGTRTVWVTKSADDGANWSAPVEITRTVKAPDWTWYATGPGVGIQLRGGRLVIPCDHVTKDRVYRSHVIYSDDHGVNWKLGGVVGDAVNECQVAELADGSLMLNMRNGVGNEIKNRAIATSKDRGLTWSKVTYDPVLIEPQCQASLLRYTDQRSGDKNRLIFANPASATSREKMTVRLSYDEGNTWPIAKLLHAGPAGYSCLAVLRDMSIGILYERGDVHQKEKISFALFDAEWLTDGTDELKRKKQ